MIETYLIHSVLELRYRESRITKADEMIEDRAARFLRAPAETRYLIAPQHGHRRSWRKRGSRDPKWRRTMRGRRTSNLRRSKESANL